MCGIVGLFIKDPALQPQLGLLLAGMLGALSDRGPDSAGFAIYGDEAAARSKLTVRSQATDLRELGKTLQASLGVEVTAVCRDSHAVLSLPSDKVEAALDELATFGSDLTVTSLGRRMEIYKDVGRPERVAERFALASMSGTHGVGHTRMATESAVTMQGAHPFSTGPDQCLVHNGSLSNHNSVRRRLQREGLTFATENDSEVAAGYLSCRMREGASLREALQDSLCELDGFYTFVVGAERGFAVLRDPVSCKPAVMAETDRYVAFGSEYRALVGLPGIETATVFEPAPAKVYAWEHA
jgi:glutamate synthase domain-containing protein 1